MDSGSLLRRARDLAGLTQRELAARSGLPQAHISLLERGKGSPTFRTVDTILAACGYQLSSRLVPLASATLAPFEGTAEERLAAAGVDFESMLALWTLVKSLDVVVVGPTALALHGAPVPSPDVHIVIADLAQCFERAVHELWMVGCQGGEWPGVPEALEALPTQGTSGVRLDVRGGGVVVHAFEVSAVVTVELTDRPAQVATIPAVLAHLDRDLAASYAPALRVLSAT